jgi:uncharacterized membrane protein YbhN (UPF0104 family)
MRRVLLLLLKAGITALLIYLSVRSVDVAVVKERLANIAPYPLAFAVAILLVQIVVQALRWQHVVTAAGADFPASASIRLSFIAAFFNQTLPSTIGGDSARVWVLAKAYQAGWRKAAYSVFVDRAVGVFGHAVLGVACLPWTIEFVRDPAGRLAVAAIGFGGVFAGFVFAALTAAKGSLLDRFWLTHHFVAAANVLRRLAAKPRSALLVAALTLLIHVLTVVVAWAVARAILVELDFQLALCLIPPVVLMATVPITIAGWGLRESLMITAFTLAGLDGGNALVISVLIGAVNFLVGVFGGLLWIAVRLRGEDEASLPPADQERR